MMLRTVNKLAHWRPFFLSMVTTTVIFVIILSLVFGNFFNRVDAQVALLYPSTCLGGWKNVDLATGVPEVFGHKFVYYSDENSATFDNQMTELFCGGFKGLLPDKVKPTSVTLYPKKSVA